jgi:beta-1,4-mannosyltransferase
MSAVTWALGLLMAVYIIVPLALYVLSPPHLTAEDLQKRQRAIVLVLGDLGRSPRMNYHALSLAKCNLDVHLCGYTQSNLMDEINEEKRITVHSITEIHNVKNWPFVIFAVYKVVLQHYYLYILLKQLKGASFLIVQNPPSIPTLGMVRFFVLFMSPRTKLIIDWHNLGYSILGLKLGESHLFVKLYKLYEKWMGHRAFVHLTVTVSLGEFLRAEFGMNRRRIIPLYDRPASQFALISEKERKEIIANHKDIFQDFDFRNEKIVVTSTSYTPDENLYTLLEALKLYCKSNAGPKLRVVITGKGPMLEEMKEEIHRLEPEFKDRISIHTVWLAYEDYPKILGVADLGVSLHESSSGWDLPMKIVDMFGCGIPVISVGFPALEELVKNHENGVIVNGSEEMTKALESVFTKPGILDNLKRGAVRESRIKWDTNWTEKLGPLFGVGTYRPVPDDYESESSSDDE